MPVILIADASKPSLVMSSEVFKDKITGAQILVATTGKHCLEILAENKPDMCVVDFDLPDVDGVTLIHAIRKIYQGPILLTAYPDKSVEQAVSEGLFAFNDAGAWLAKPVKFDTLSAKIDQFLLDKFRLGRRFYCDMQTLMVGKGAGRGKRAPKITGRVTNISLGGACIELASPTKLQLGEEITVTLALPFAGASAQAKPVKSSLTKKLFPLKSAASKSKSKAEEEESPEAKVRCTVAWMDRKHTKAGVAFARMTEIQKKALETLLRNCEPIPVSETLNGVEASKD